MGFPYRGPLLVYKNDRHICPLLGYKNDRHDSPLLVYENDLLAGTKTMLGNALLLLTYISSEADWI